MSGKSICSTAPTIVDSFTKSCSQRERNCAIRGATRISSTAAELRLVVRTPCAHSPDRATTVKNPPAEQVAFRLSPRGA
jgi:hypothetical protein